MTLLLHTMQNEHHPAHKHQTSSLGRNPIHTGLRSVNICCLIKHSDSKAFQINRFDFTHIGVDFWMASSKWAIAVQYDTTVSRAFIQVLLSICTPWGWANLWLVTPEGGIRGEFSMI